VSNRDLLLNDLCLFKGEHSKCNNCRARGSCRVNEKTDEQIDYILSSVEKSIFLKACPGSGKTEVVAMKAAYEISRWNKNGGIAILSFTNNAADVIADRVAEFYGLEGVSHPHFIGTFDSWLHTYLAHPFLHHITNYVGDRDRDDDKSFRLVDEKDYADGDSKLYLYAYKTITPYLSLSGERLNKLSVFANNIMWESDWHILNPWGKWSDPISLDSFCSSLAFEKYKTEKDKNGKDKNWLTKAHVSAGIDEAKSKFN
jgi:hypothetical protein